MPLPLAVPAIIAGVSALAKMGVGSSQSADGKRLLNKTSRPEYTRPKEIDELLSLVSANYGNSRIAGQTATENKISQTSANAASLASAGGDPLSLLPAILANENNATLGLGAQVTAQKLQDRRDLVSALEMSADYSDLEFQINKFAPYSQEQQEGRDMIGAGTKNIFSGLDGMASIGSILSNNISGNTVDHQQSEAIKAKYTSNKTGSGMPLGLNWPTENTILGEYKDNPY